MVQVLALLLSTLTALLPPPSIGPAGGGGYEVRQKAGVYFGDAADFSRPAALEAVRVFDRIPEYQEIKQRRLPPNDPEYGILLEKANKRFFRAVCKTAKRDGWDLVAEVGAVVDRSGQPLRDITLEVVRAVEEG